MNKRLVHDKAEKIAVKAAAFVADHGVRGDGLHECLAGFYDVAAAVLAEYTEEYDRMRARLDPTGRGEP